MSVRSVIFWIHLVAGVLVAVPVVIMSATGVAIAFEEEILNAFDREQRVVPHTPDAARRSIAVLRADVARQQPDFAASRVVVPRAADAAFVFFAGREGMLYVNPYTGSATVPASTGAHAVLHEVEAWHRFLGREGDTLIVGKVINGVANAVLLLLCVTGLYLWVPRRWNRAALRRSLLFVRTRGSKARDFNWHHVVGFWGLPVLSVLVASAVVISFPFAHALVFTLAGEDVPPGRGPAILAVPEARVPTPAAGSAPLDLDTLVARVAARFPERDAIVVDLSAAEPESPGEHAPPTSVDERAAIQPRVELAVMLPALFSTHGRVPVQVDPYTGDILSETHFRDYSPGVRARVWLRFLHTGAAFGLFGKILAALATLGSLLLVYTGLALSYRRFFGGRSRKRGASSVALTLLTLLLLSSCDTSAIGTAVAHEEQTELLAHEEARPESALREAHMDLVAPDTGHVHSIDLFWPSGAAPERGFPVVVLLDGHRVSPIIREALEAGVRLEAAYLCLGYQGLPSDAQRFRARDYTPAVTPGEPEADPLDASRQNGGALGFRHFLASVVREQASRRASLAWDEATLVGHSYGGLFVLSTLLDAPDSYARYVAVDPSLWWRSAHMFERIMRAQPVAPGVLTLLEANHALEPEAPRGAPTRDPARLALRQRLQAVLPADAFTRVATHLGATHRYYPAHHHGSLLEHSVRELLGVAR